MTAEKLADALAGRRIGVPEARQLDLLADMLERRGAMVARCPLVDIRDTPDRDAVQRWLDDVIENGVDDMIWLTGEGLRRLRGFCERAGGDCLARFTQRLGVARNITRGPKPARELRAIQLRTDMSAAQPTTDGVIETLAATDLAGHRVGVQLYGSDPNDKLMAFLAERQALALPVSPYVYADEAEQPQVVAFIRRILAGELDALAFTSSPQVKRLFKVARAERLESELVRALQSLCVAAVGPLVAERIEKAGVCVTLTPEKNYSMKPMVRALSAYFERA